MTTQNRTQKELEMNTKIITKNPYGIKTPKSVKEFRENLKKYYLVSPINKEVFEYEVNVDDLEIENLSLVVQGKEIPLMDLTSLTDLYKICEGEPMITPKMVMVKDRKDYMDETDQFISINDYYSNENNFKVYENQDEFVSKYLQKFLTEGEPSWYSLDNQITREFYMMTLGDFSGCRYEEVQ